MRCAFVKPGGEKRTAAVILNPLRFWNHFFQFTCLLVGCVCVCGGGGGDQNGVCTCLYGLSSWGRKRGRQQSCAEIGCAFGIRFFFFFNVLRFGWGVWMEVKMTIDALVYTGV